MSLTQDEARQYCRQRGIGPNLTRSEKMALSDQDFRMYAAAYPGNPKDLDLYQLRERENLRLNHIWKRQLERLKEDDPDS